MGLSEIPHRFAADDSRYFVPSLSAGAFSRMRDIQPDLRAPDQSVRAGRDQDPGRARSEFDASICRPPPDKAGEPCRYTPASKNRAVRLLQNTAAGYTLRSRTVRSESSVRPRTSADAHGASASTTCKAASLKASDGLLSQIALADCAHFLRLPVPGSSGTLAHNLPKMRFAEESPGRRRVADAHRATAA